MFIVHFNKAGSIDRLNIRSPKINVPGILIIDKILIELFVVCRGLGAAGIDVDAILTDIVQAVIARDISFKIETQLTTALSEAMVEENINISCGVIHLIVRIHISISAQKTTFNQTVTYCTTIG